MFCCFIIIIIINIDININIISSSIIVVIVVNIFNGFISIIILQCELSKIDFLII